MYVVNCNSSQPVVHLLLDTRVQLEQTLTAKETQIDVQATEARNTEERMKLLETQLQQIQVG